MLGTISSDPAGNISYILPRNGVSFKGAGRGVSVLMIKPGENARYPSTNAPNVISTNQTAPLAHANFEDFTIDWLGCFNLLTQAMTRRQNAGIFSGHGGIDIHVRRVEVRETPGDQCVFMPAQAELGQGNITVEDSNFADSGSGLPGNINTDHSSVYCNGANITYRNLRGKNTNMQYGALFELHGDRGVAIGCSGDNYEHPFWIAADFQAITGNVVSDSHFTNLRLAFGVASPTWPVNGNRIHHCSFREKVGEPATVVTYFINGFAIAASDSLEIDHCWFWGQNKPLGRFMQHDRIAAFNFHHNHVEKFNDSAQGHGIVTSGTDIGTGLCANSIEIDDNTWVDVYRPVAFTPGTGLGVKYFSACRNKAYNSINPAQNVIQVTVPVGDGVVEANSWDANYLPPRVQGANNIKNKQMRSAATAYAGVTLADGVGTTVLVTVVGLDPADNDKVSASLSVPLQGVTVTASANATDQAAVRIQNESGGAVTLAACTIVAEGARM